MDIAPGRKRALGGLLLPDSDQSVVRASQLAQHDRPLAAGVRCRLVLAGVVPPPDVVPLLPTRGAGACHPHVGAIDPHVRHRQDIHLRAGVDLHATAHLHAHEALCHLRLDFVRMVRAYDSEVERMRGYVSLKG
jgi:hypothetical protein